ncbi:hypothetical protein C8A03DRAFT_30899 [Achaetomium macrosporum]|uniref:Uncharacterized protein n=1 Tax=Achaetomium macrosporum TaxID=79813 RepID=A0AAN7HDH9_9PEZI|nr:hypothetical protein C8A03DRAFT_30899 [Achaetomium macrosporum]
MASPWARHLLISLVSMAILASITYRLFDFRDGLGALSPTRIWAAATQQEQHQQCNCHVHLPPFPEKQTFFHDLLHPNSPADPNSLLGRARHIVQTDGGNAFVRIAEQDGPPRSYGVSMFHALHCLEMIRGAVHHHDNSTTTTTTPHDHDHNHSHSTTPRTRNTTTSSKKKKKKKRSLEAPAHILEASMSMTRAEHLDHCLDYLAQSIVCSGDDTLEPSFRGRLSGSGEEVVVIDGVGAVHQCRDVRGVHEAMVRSVEEEPVRVGRELRQGERLGDVLRRVVDTGKER